MSTKRRFTVDKNTENLTEKSKKWKDAREHFKVAHEAMRESIKDWLPKGYIEHRKTVKKEILLGIREIIDAAIEHTEK